MAIDAPKISSPSVRSTTPAPVTPDAEVAKLKEMLKNGPAGFYKKLDDFLKTHPTFDQIVHASKNFRDNLR